MKKIDFFIIGAQKSGTTSLFEYLKSIKSKIQLPLVKEMQVFTDENLYADFPHNINSFYSQDFLETHRIGMADVGILFSYNKTAQRIYDYNPEAKIIIMLRDPIKRAYSAYYFSRKNTREKENLFSTAIFDESRDLLSENDQLALNYLKVSSYYEQTKTFLNLFNKDQVYICIMEEFLLNKEREFLKILNFLDVSSDSFDINILNKKYNEGGVAKYKFVQKLFKQDNWLRKIYKQTFSLENRMKFRNKYINPLLKINMLNVKSPDLDLLTRKKLEEYFDEEVKKLTILLDKDLKKLWF